ncbi:Meiotically up-regulated protein [Oopsacas minuta]|uniref:Meiotically up-regulated protein n=1 Tax=Oopsacas minuta TaxID=111878 RepID=A0AAV7K6J5_9METZ|nr:Meiotically up-regulated protein [Oopsacas minuta]
MSETRIKSVILTGRAGQETRFQSLKPLDLSTSNKSQIQAYFENTYDFDENLFLCIKDPSSMLLTPNRLRLPIIFYYGHTAAVFVNKLFISGFIKERVDLEFEKIFETGVDEMSWDDTDSFRMGGALNWPSLERIIEYRRNVRKLILDVIDSTPLQLPITWDSTWWSLMLAIDHARIHIELSSVMLRELPVELVERPSAWSYGPREPIVPIGENNFIEVPAGKVTLGKPRDFPAYGWDNEFGKEEMETSTFKASRYLVTNAQFLEFVEARGYENKEYWTEEGWKWVVYTKPKHPHFWVCQEECESMCGEDLSNYSHCNSKAENKNNDMNREDGSSSPSKTTRYAKSFLYRAMFDNIAMPWSWPVEVNFLEAKAFCKWTGSNFRLPTEAEHHLMRGNELSSDFGNKSDPAFIDKPPFNSNLQYCSSTPVNFFPPSDNGFYDAYGNVWDWTECHFNGFKDFETHKVYDDFSTPCFAGTHNILMGGAWVSSGTSASRYGRFAFRRHFFQHAGFRLVEALNRDSTPARVCSAKAFIPLHGFMESSIDVFGLKSNNVLESYNLQFTTELDDAFKQEVEFSLANSDMVVSYLHKLDHGSGRFIHLGCGLGKICYELSRDFTSILGIDYSGRFIDYCLKVKSKSPLVNIPGYKIADDIRYDKLDFKQFTWLSNEIPPSDVVLVTLLDRVMNPAAWALKLFEIVKVGKTAVIVSTIDLASLEGMMIRFQLKGSETPFKNQNLILSFWVLQATDTRGMN